MSSQILLPNILPLLPEFLLNLLPNMIWEDSSHFWEEGGNPASIVD